MNNIVINITWLDMRFSVFDAAAAHIADPYAWATGMSIKVESEKNLIKTNVDLI